ncbi:MAG: STAS/SEC14 domain-containing protein [Gammaproteobacteria bacterium]|nr:STAS/SEC14 domain-containing protein [Gammaproteobacteria bacterium]NNJ73482.1 STAS/SEC14 domain-containing protein [Enterobacterales bacterium]
MSDVHGFNIGIERHNGEIYVMLKAVGKLTHEDYEVMTPILESAMSEVKQPMVNVLADMREFEGVELRAAWDDMKFGLKHNNDFHRIAIVGNAPWQEVMSKVGGWFISGECKYFDDVTTAQYWLHDDS